MSDDEPPPLEDMTRDLERMGRITSIPASQLESLPSQQSNRKAQSSTTGDNSSKNSSTLSAKKSVEKKAAPDNKGFCGFQKGFLSGSSKPSVKTGNPTRITSETTMKKSNNASKQVDDIIRPKKNGGKSGLELPEVQEALRETYPALATDKWLTEDLMKKVEEDPVLAKSFSDPAMMQYLNLLQTNPKQAFAAAQGNPDLQKCMQAFCSTLGTHFSSLGDGESSLGNAAPEPPIISEDEAKVKKLISKPEVRSALEDPLVTKLLHLLKTDPHAAQRRVTRYFIV